MVYLVMIFCRLLEALILVRMFMSWVPMINQNHPLIEFIYKYSEYILGPIRRILPQTNLPIDFSPIVAFLLIEVFERGILRNFYF